MAASDADHPDQPGQHEGSRDIAKPRENAPKNKRSGPGGGDPGRRDAIERGDLLGMNTVGEDQCSVRLRAAWKRRNLAVRVHTRTGCAAMPAAPNTRR